MKAIVFSLIILIFCTVVNGIDIVTPSQFLGFPVGADRKLANWVQISEYFQLLDSKSNRVLVQEIGKTTENNPFLLVTISSKENLNNLKHYLEIQNQLADPRKVKDSPAQLISEGKTIILVTCGIHATEVSSPQMSMEFAWEIATQNDKDTSEILENVIFLLVPSQTLLLVTQQHILAFCSALLFLSSRLHQWYSKSPVLPYWQSYCLLISDY